jgi:hypothetical protein
MGLGSRSALSLAVARAREKAAEDARLPDSTPWRFSALGLMGRALGGSLARPRRRGTGVAGGCITGKCTPALVGRSSTFGVSFLQHLSEISRFRDRRRSKVLPR